MPPIGAWALPEIALAGETGSAAGSGWPVRRAILGRSEPEVLSEQLVGDGLGPQIAGVIGEDLECEGWCQRAGLSIRRTANPGRSDDPQGVWASLARSNRIDGRCGMRGRVNIKGRISLSSLL